MFLDLAISPNRCETKNCIGVEGSTIVIENVWTLKESVIEEAMVGLLSHETIEYLLMDNKEINDHKSAISIHDLIGWHQKVKDYVFNTDGLVCTKKKF
jgi:hypothetical protein